MCPALLTGSTISKGRNKNLVVEIQGEFLGNQFQSLEHPYCMYVPGLAGIPFNEQYIALGAVRRSAAKGDSNIIFRNILLQLKAQSNDWNNFRKTIQNVFPEIKIDVSCDMDLSGEVVAEVSMGDRSLPIDAMGTGILQAVQISAYIHLFKPQILLLDEPDSHLHPNNQIALANILKTLTDQLGTRIILATHSRTLIGALKSTAKFFRVNNGNIYSEDNFDYYAVLLELGALDDFDRLKNGEKKYIVLTEDSSRESHDLLSKILTASGMDENNYLLYSYDGVNKIESAKMFSQFLIELHPNIQVIIHRDRDGLSSDEVNDHRAKICFDPRVYCFITAANDIESYFCRTDHIKFVCTKENVAITDSEIIEIINQAKSEIKEYSLGKYISHRLEIEKSQKHRTDNGHLYVKASSAYDADVDIYVCGKTLRGKIADLLQQKFQKNINLKQYSEYLNEGYIRTTTLGL